MVVSRIIHLVKHIGMASRLTGTYGCSFIPATVYPPSLSKTHSPLPWDTFKSHVSLQNDIWIGDEQIHWGLNMLSKVFCFCNLIQFYRQLLTIQKNHAGISIRILWKRLPFLEIFKVSLFGNVSSCLFFFWEKEMRDSYVVQYNKIPLSFGILFVCLPSSSSLQTSTHLTGLA